MPQVREIPPEASSLAATALVELRPQAGDVTTIVARIDHQRMMGYRVAGSFDDGIDDAAAVAGFRTVETLAWGRILYVDDLVTVTARRGRGHATALMSWLEAEAERTGCAELHLDSAVGPERADAHRLYFRHRMRISAYHFSRRMR